MAEPKRPGSAPPPSTPPPSTTPVIATPIAQVSTVAGGALPTVVGGATAASGRWFQPGDVLAGRYRVERFLAAGGMGEVYRVRDLELDLDVALKTIRPSIAGDPVALRRFKREVLLTRSIAHPGVCRIFDFGRHGADGRDVAFLTMELLDGRSLAVHIAARGALSTAEALPVVRAMASALAAAHRSGIVHRDFKSANVMLVPTAGGDRAVVCDFGLAVAPPFLSGAASGVAAAAADDGVHKERAAVGTPSYMAPEQVRGEPVGPAADVYALGVVLFEMVTGTLPFVGPTALATAAARLTEEVPRPSLLTADLDPVWEAVILRCLARDPVERFPSADAVLQALTGEVTPSTGSSLWSSRPPIVLPAERDAFFGRTVELAELQSRVASGRLVTLRGAGGTGKSRLAIHFAWRVADQWPGGVYLADLSQARSVDAVAAALAAALDIPLVSGDPAAQLGHAIAGRGRALFVVDHCDGAAEHVGATLARWQERASAAGFLLISRVRLPIEGDVIVLGPLPEDPALELFFDRVESARPGLARDAPTIAAGREVVRRLDGLPLAIELAAARAGLLTPAQIAARLGDRFRLLAGGTPGRHATLQAVLDESWEPLAGWEKAALAQAAVFEGGFTLEAAEAVLDLGAFPEALWAIDVVQSLVDKSLVRVLAAAGADEPRLGLDGSIATYARRRLDQTGAAGALAAEQRHAAYYTRAAAVLDTLDGQGGVSRRRLVLDLDNVLAATRRAVARGDGASAVRGFCTAWEALETRGPYALAIGLGRQVLAIEGLSPALGGAAATAMGRALWRSGRPAEAHEHLARALVLHRQVGERRAEGAVLRNLGVLHWEQGDGDAALRDYQQCLAIHRAVGTRSQEGIVLGNLGILRNEQGDIDGALQDYRAALAIHREVGNRRFEGIVLGNLGALYDGQGRADEALRHYQQSLAIEREVGDRRGEGVALGNLGSLHVVQGRMDEALQLCTQALAIHRQVGDRRFEGIALGNLGSVHEQQGRFDAARRCYQEALAIAREVGKRGLEGFLLGSLGGLDTQQGEFAAARACFDQGEALLRSAGDRIQLGMLLCQRGDYERRVDNLAAAHRCLAEAEAITSEMCAGPASQLGQETARLRAELGR